MGHKAIIPVGLKSALISMDEEKKKGKTEEALSKTVKGAEEGLKKGWDKVKGAGKKVKEDIEGGEKEEKKK